jgi:ribosomal protein S18 acetylase RimI-like enzyme
VGHGRGGGGLIRTGAVRTRIATLEDLSQLAELTSTLGYSAEPEALRPRLQRTLAREDMVLYVAHADPGGVVGWILGGEQETLESGPRCEILGLVVAEAGRRRGIGRRLVDAVEAWGRVRGLSRVVVRSNVVRAEAHPFYERIGYQRVKTQHVYAKGL